MPLGWQIAVVVLWLALIAMAVVVLGVLRQVTTALEQAQSGGHGHHPAPPGQGPPLGEQVPHFAAVDTAGLPVDDELVRGHPALLLFMHLGCAPCEELAREMGRSDMSRLAGQLIVVTDPGGARDLPIPAGIRVVAETGEEQITGPLQITGWPFAVVIDPAGLVQATSVPNTVAQLEDLAAVLA